LMEKQVCYALVGDSGGRLCINLSLPYLRNEDHQAFLGALFGAAGLQVRALIFEKNRECPDGKWRVNWNELRVSKEQCDMAGIPAHIAADKIRAWMRGPLPEQEFGLDIRVGEEVWETI
jgi:hypothetical protein